MGDIAHLSRRVLLGISLDRATSHRQCPTGNTSRQHKTMRATFVYIYCDSSGVRCLHLGDSQVVAVESVANREGGMVSELVGVRNQNQDQDQDHTRVRIRVT